MAVKSSPSATGTPTTGAPASVGSDAAASLTPELKTIDDVFLADMTGDAEATAGDEDSPGESPSPIDGDDSSLFAETEEATDGDGTEESGEEDTSDPDDDDSETPEADPETDEADPAATQKPGLPAAIRKALEDAKIPHGLQKRIDKAFQHNQTYRAEIDRLQGELAATPEPITLTPTLTHPLSDVQTPEQLDDRRAAAEFWLDFAAENPDGGSVGTGAQSRELTADEVKAQRQWATNVLKGLPARQQWLAARQQARTTAQKALPEMFKKDTPEYKAARALIQGTPELVNQPDYEQTLADMVNGLKYRVKQAQGWTLALVPPSKKKASPQPDPSAITGKASPKPKPTAPPHSRPSPSPTSGKPDIDALYAKAAASGSAVDIERLLAAELA